ncbi:MAG: hypothetical protein JNL68_08700 [Burkholderiales bacterium]|nr:hypothetical protein [Burkholderiales bacterium]
MEQLIAFESRVPDPPILRDKRDDLLVAARRDPAKRCVSGIARACRRPRPSIESERPARGTDIAEGASL